MSDGYFFLCSLMIHFDSSSWGKLPQKVTQKVHFFHPDHFDKYICPLPNKISVFCLISKDNMLQDKAICCGFRDQVNSSFQNLSLSTIKQKIWNIFEIYFMPFLWRLTHGALWSDWINEIFFKLFSWSKFGRKSIKNLVRVVWYKQDWS